MAFDIETLRARLRDQLDSAAPAPTIPTADDFDLYDEENDEAVQIVLALEARDNMANGLVAGAVHTLSVLDVTDGVTTMSLMLMTGRAVQWLVTAPTSAETEVAA